jgi:tRNA-Thr(GGU) m(6)t(6)A37 methyltransferase TsaA
LGVIGHDQLMEISMRPVAWVRGGRSEPTDDHWDREVAMIELDDRFGPGSLAQLEAFSHLDVVFVFDRVDESEVHLGARRPRGRGDWPEVGIFAQRGKARPNRIGVTTCRIEDVRGTTIQVRGLDAIDGTPVLDLKPHMSGFAARGEVVEPGWAREIMAEYWSA